MKNYKDYEKKYIGSSDMARLLLRPCSGDPAELKFIFDGAYMAYVVDENAEIGGHYTVTHEFNGCHWLSVYDDTEKVITFHADSIRVYRSGDFGCIIQLFGNRDDGMIQIKEDRYEL